MKKLIATDLDGTLFYPKRKITGIPHTNVKFLKKFLSNDGQLVLISGRNPKILSKIERQLNHSVSLIGCNGGFCVDENKDILFTNPLDKEKLTELYSYIHHAFGIWIWMMFNTTNQIYCDVREIPDWMKRMFVIGNKFRFYFAETLLLDDKLFIDRLTHQDCYKMMIVFGLGEDGKERAAQASPALKSRFGDFFEFAVSNNAIEITAKGIDKGNSLMQFCKIKNINPDDVFVCGDSGNDLYMFEKFKHSFAMSHSPDHFKSQANHVVDRISSLSEYIDDPSLVEKDEIIQINYEKALDK